MKSYTLSDIKVILRTYSKLLKSVDVYNCKSTNIKYITILAEFARIKKKSIDWCFSRLFQFSYINPIIQQHIIKEKLDQLIRDKYKYYRLIAERFNIQIIEYKWNKHTIKEQQQIQQEQQYICYSSYNENDVLLLTKSSRSNLFIVCVFDNELYLCSDLFEQYVDIHPYKFYSKSIATKQISKLNDNPVTSIPEDVVNLLSKDPLTQQLITTIELNNFYRYSLKRKETFIVKKIRKSLCIFNIVGGDLSQNQCLRLIYSTWYRCKHKKVNQTICLGIQRMCKAFNVYELHLTSRSFNLFLKSDIPVSSVIYTANNPSFKLPFKCTENRSHTSTRKHCCPCIGTYLSEPNYQRVSFDSYFTTLPMTITSLGWDCTESDDLLRKAGTLSLGLYDIESITNIAKSLNGGSRTEVTIYRKEDLLNKQNLESGCFGSQTIVLIGFGDYINNEMENILKSYTSTTDLQRKADLRLQLISLCTLNKPTTKLKSKIFHLRGNHVKSGRTESTFMTQLSLVKQFLKYVGERSILAYKLKLIILKPFLDTLDMIKFKIKYILKDDKPFMYKSVYYSLERYLKQLLRNYILFAFAGSRYDMCLLLPFLNVLYSQNLSRVKSPDPDNYMPSSFYRFKYNIITRGNDILYIKIVLTNNAVVIFRDFKKLVNPFMTLSALTLIYATNTKMEKWTFPHSLSSSVKFLKTRSSLPTDPLEWRNILTGICPPVSEIQKANDDLKSKKCSSLYEYLVMYLKNDINIFREAVFFHRLNVWNVYQLDYVVLNKFTLSGLSSYAAFGKYPSNNVDYITPFDLNHIASNRLINCSIIGGLTMCGYYGDYVTLDQQKSNSNKFTKPVYINEHLKQSDLSQNISKTVWPTLHHLKNTISFTGKKDSLITKDSLLPCTNISTFDITSLYPSAMTERLPFGEIGIWNAYSSQYSVTSTCPYNVDNITTLQTMKFVRQVPKKREIYTEEFYAIRYFLTYEFPYSTQDILHVRSGSHAGGRICFEHRCYPDLYIVSRDKLQHITTPSGNHRKRLKLCPIIYIYVINYNGIYYHGHMTSCPYFDESKDISYHREIEDRRKKYFKTLIHEHPFSSLIELKCVTLSPCIYNLCVVYRPNDIKQMLSHKHDLFPNIGCNELTSGQIKELIFKGTISGLVTIQNLIIKDNSLHPSFGFCVQRTSVPYNNGNGNGNGNNGNDDDDNKDIGNGNGNGNNGNDDDDNKDSRNNEHSMILSLHQYKNVNVISCDYLKYLYDTFDIDMNFKILHLIEYKKSKYLSSFISTLLTRRAEIKVLLKQTNPQTNPSVYADLTMQAHTIKLFLNSMYGYLLLNVSNYNTVKYIKESSLSKQKLKRELKNTNRYINSVDPVGVLENYNKKNELLYLVRILRKPHIGSFEHRYLGSEILWNSKKIFLDSLYFLLRHLDVKRGEWLYCDTDSLHFGFAFKDLIDNIHPSMKQSFLQHAHKYLGWFKNAKVYGTLVKEGDYIVIYYRDEKIYMKLKDLDDVGSICMKGVKGSVINMLYRNESKQNPFQEKPCDEFVSHCVSLSPNRTGYIYIMAQTKHISFKPRKRQFRENGHSVVYDLTNKSPTVPVNLSVKENFR